MQALVAVAHGFSTTVMIGVRAGQRACLLLLLGRLVRLPKSHPAAVHSTEWPCLAIGHIHDRYV
jgi:hypothetical protein